MHMIATMSENAILAKAMAMYAGRITPKQYKDMMNCKNVNEVAGYLKSHTVYAKALEDVNAATIHRDRLELSLRKYLFYQYESLCHYEYTLGRNFHKYFILRGDIEQIFECVRLLQNGKPGEYLFTLPDFFSQHSELDLYAMGQATTFDELDAAMAKSSYYKVISSFFKKGKKQINIPRLDAALTKYEFEELIHLVKENLSGKSRKEFLNLIAKQIDLYNLSALYRIKHFANNDYGFIMAMVVTQGGTLPAKQLDAMIRARDEKEFLVLAGQTPYRSCFDNDDFDYIELACQNYLYRESKKDLRFSTNPLIVMMAYTQLLETEVTNIIHIVESIRYGVSSDVMQKLLIGVEN